MERLRLGYQCPLAWNKLKGDARVRHCTTCDTPVVNLSSLTRAEAERAVARARAERGAVCVRFVEDSDGRVEYAEPPPSRRRLPVLVGAAAALALTIALPDGARADMTPPTPCAADTKGAPDVTTAPTSTGKSKNGRIVKRGRKPQSPKRFDKREVMGLLAPAF